MFLNNYNSLQMIILFVFCTITIIFKILLFEIVIKFDFQWKSSKANMSQIRLRFSPFLPLVQRATFYYTVYHKAGR